jgi:hypothetical protein
MTCKTHPDAPHGFVRGASHSEDRYVCECEFWEEPKMNDRIRELADEAGLRFTQLMSNPMVPVVDGRETDLEKFAELIVRECIDIAEQTRYDGKVVAARIKFVFGVEE